MVYTNAEEVELTLNGRSLGIRQNPVNQPDQRNTLHWDSIAYQPGRLTAIARTGGHEVARHMLRTTGKAVALKLVPESTTWRADGMDLQYVRVYAVDSRGQHVPTAQGNVTFHVAGAAYLLAVDNGNHVSDELFAGPQRQLHNGAAPLHPAFRPHCRYCTGRSQCRRTSHGENRTENYPLADSSTNQNHLKP